MNQATLFSESLADALIETVNQLGGPKRVGLELWPSKSMAQAQSQLLHCLNPERRETLALEEIDHILRLARSADVLTPFKYMADTFDLELRLIDPADKKAELQREFTQGVDRLQRLAQQLQGMK